MRVLLIILCLLMSGFTVLAQEDTETVTMSGAFTFSYTEDWTVDSEDGNGFFFLTEDSSIRIRTYSPRTQAFFELEVANLEAMMEWFVTDVFETRGFDEDAVETVSFGDYEGLKYLYEEQSEGDEYQRAIFIYSVENDFVVAGYIRPIADGALNTDDVDALQAAMSTVIVQDTFTFYEGTTVEIPDGWQLYDAYNATYAGAGVTNGDLSMRITLSPGWGAITGLEEPDNFLAYIYEDRFIEISPFSRARLQETRVAGYDAFYYPIESDRVNSDGMFERGIIVFIIPNNSAFDVQITSTSPNESIEPVYEVLDTLEAGTRIVCTLFADPGIRIREEPATNSAIVRETDDEGLVALSTTTDSGGFVWFNVGEGWVRSDVIYYEQNACADLPEE